MKPKKRIMKKSDSLYLGLMARIDDVSDLLQAFCWALVFIENKKLFPEFTKYLEKHFKEE